MSGTSSSGRFPQGSEDGRQESRSDNPAEADNLDGLTFKQARKRAEAEGLLVYPWKVDDEGPDWRGTPSLARRPEIWDECQQTDAGIRWKVASLADIDAEAHAMRQLEQDELESWLESREGQLVANANEKIKAEYEAACKLIDAKRAHHNRAVKGGYLSVERPEGAVGWTSLSLSELASTPVEPPQVAELFYLGQRHVLSGEADIGKTWVALWAAAQEIRAGHAVAWVNTDEMPPRELFERLTAFGVTDEDIADRFLYFQPDVKADPEEIALLADVVTERGARLCVVDSFNSAMMVEGLDPLKTVEVETFWRQLATPLCRAGCAFVAIDHLPKSSDNHGRYSYGSERKLTGASVHIGVRGKGFSREDDGGTVRLYNHKDRTGYLPKPIVGDFELNVVAGMARATITPVSEEEAGRLTGYMEKVSRALESVAPKGLSVREVEMAVGGKKEHVDKALRDLVEEGYVQRTKDGQRLIHTVSRPFVEDE
jgi:hypothetical protein